MTSAAHWALDALPGAAQSLNGRIGDFAALVGTVLVLVTLFTQQRSDKPRRLKEGVVEKRDWTTEVFLNVVLFLVTLCLFLAGLPLVLDCLEAFHPRADSGPLRSAFTIVWALLLALMGWQVSLVRAAWTGRDEWIRAHASAPLKRKA